MTIEQYCEDFSQHLRTQTARFAGELRSVVHSIDYARAIASLTREILSSEAQRKLWIDRFGLLYCVFIVPSELFVTPVKSLFAMDNWALDEHPHEDLSDPDDPDNTSFFAPESLRRGILHVHYVGDRAHSPSQPPLGNGRADTVRLDQNFMKYLDAWYDRIGDDGAEYMTDEETVQFETLFSEIGIERLLGYRDAPVDQYCKAVIELTSVTRDRRPLGQHVYLTATNVAETHSGTFCFLFQHGLNSSYRVLLRLICHGLSTFFRSLEQLELRQRTTLSQEQSAIPHPDLHDLRNALGSLGNKLHTMRLRSHDNSESASHISAALRFHSQSLRCVDDLESRALSSSILVRPTFNLQTLTDLWWTQWQTPSYLSLWLEDAEELKEEQFELPSSARELGQAIYQFVETALANPSAEMTDTDTESHPEDYWPSVRARLNLAESELSIRIGSGFGFPEYIEDAVRAVTILDRLPSLKHSGGRGILSAVTTIRNQYRGKVRFENIPLYMAFWDVSVPVILVRQFRLFQ